MLNDRVQSVSRLQSALVKAEDYLSKLPPGTPFSEFEYGWVAFTLCEDHFYINFSRINFSAVIWVRMQTARYGIWERLGWYCCKSTGNDTPSIRYTSGSWSFYVGNISWEDTHGVQRCHLVSTWVFWSSKCFRLTRHWGTGSSPEILSETALNMFSRNWLFNSPSSKICYKSNADRLYTGPSTCPGKWDVTQNKETGFGHYPQNSDSKHLGHSYRPVT